MARSDKGMPNGNKSAPPERVRIIGGEFAGAVYAAADVLPPMCTARYCACLEFEIGTHARVIETGALFRYDGWQWLPVEEE